VAELVEKFSSSDDRIDGKLSRLRWIPVYKTLDVDDASHG